MKQLDISSAVGVHPGLHVHSEKAAAINPIYDGANWPLVTQYAAASLTIKSRTQKYSKPLVVNITISPEAF